MLLRWTKVTKPDKSGHQSETPSHHSLAILSALGDLDVLPVEMLIAVLQISDLHTLSAFTLINRQAKAIADGFMPYRLIKAIAPHILVVFTKTEVASHFTAVQVVDALCSNSCAICGRFGTYLWVPDCIRCCISCLRFSPELMAMTKQDAKAAFGLSEESLSKVPIVHSLPGKYDSPIICGDYYKRRLVIKSGNSSQDRSWGTWNGGRVKFIHQFTYLTG